MADADRAPDASEFHLSPRPNRAAEIGWRPWSEAAFAEARRTDRPILLSISAVWCHWCHVMDETSYSNAGVIDLIKNEYVPIRVDNDVRPDINQRYNMGGWPTTAFLTSSGDILTGATYLPPEQMAGALRRVASYYRTNRPEIASKVLEGRKRSGGIAARSAGELDASLVEAILNAVRSSYDPEYGGFGTAPKFPQTDAILLLLEQADVRGDPELRQMAVHTLEQMAGGGMYDHVEGGFFRYSTTQDWSVPHFEKMLEDHAGLVSAVSLAGMTTVLETATGYRVYAAWNAALAVAYLDAARRHALPDLRTHAARALERLFADRYTRDGGLVHSDGIGGQLGDQVWGLLAAVRAYQSGLGDRWLAMAGELAGHLEDRYADKNLGGYFDRSGGDELGRLADPVKPLGENSVAAIALIELDTLLGDPEQVHLGRARRALEAVASLPRQYGLMAAVFARALDRLRPPVKVTTGNEELARAAMLTHPYAVIEPSSEDRAVVCVGTICLAPVNSPAAVAESIHEATAQATSA